MTTDGDKNSPRKMDDLVFWGYTVFVFVSIFTDILWNYPFVLVIAMALENIYFWNRKPSLFKTKNGKDKSVEVLIVLLILVVLALLLKIFLSPP